MDVESTSVDLVQISHQFFSVPVRQNYITFFWVLQIASFELLNEANSIYPSKRFYQRVESSRA